MSDFSALNTALSGLTAHQRAVQTAGHNVATAATPRYSRQRVDLAIELKFALAEDEDTDMVEAIIALQAQEMAYQRALAITAKVVQPTLLDFLR